MALLTVTTAGDVVDAGDGLLSLREAVAQANATAGADTIKFATSVEGHSLRLTHGELTVTSDLVIDGNRDLNKTAVTIDGNYQSRIFHVTGDTDLELARLTLTHGQNGEDWEDGGAVLIEGGSLSLLGTTIRDSQASPDGYVGSGGAIYLEGGTSLSVVDSKLIGNGRYFGDGGAIATGKNVAISFDNSVVSGNGTYAGEGGAIDLGIGSTLTARATSFNSNGSGDYDNGWGYGGAINAPDATISLENCVIRDNSASFGGGILLDSGSLTISNSLIAENFVWGIEYGANGAGILSGGRTIMRNSTVTDNVAITSDYQTDAIYAAGVLAGDLYIANCIITGNLNIRDATFEPEEYIASDLAASELSSNGRNILGAAVGDVIPGDRVNVSGALVFATTDPLTGGGVVSANGTVALLNSALNPALSAGDPLTAGAFDQIGAARPLPAASLPDIGAAELNQRTFSTSPSAGNDLLTGTAKANTISGLSLNDRLAGLGGDDTLNGNDGSDRLDGGDGKDTLNGGQGSDLLIGGAGNDKLIGDTGIDLAFFGGSAKLTVDLVSGKATHGGETDTLSGIEGAIGSSAADTFKGDANANWFQGGLGRDVFTGAAGRDLYDFNAVAESKSGSATRDLITDFAAGTDKIDLGGIDADPTVAGNQAFRWVGTAPLDGPGELGFVLAGGNTIVQASTDADAAAEFQIQLTGVKALTAVDFFL